MFDTSANRFRLEVDWIKALPGGVETDFILVSCAGTPRPGGAGACWVPTQQRLAGLQRRDASVGLVEGKRRPRLAVTAGLHNQIPWMCCLQPGCGARCLSRPLAWL